MYFTDRQLFLIVATALSSGFGLGVGVALAAVGRLDALRWVPFAFLLGGCADFQYQRDVANVPTVKQAEARGEVTVVWRFGSSEWVNTMCNWKGGATIHGCAVLDEKAARCAVFLVAPRHFQDVDRLAVVGHEMWHCFGAKHT